MGILRMWFMMGLWEWEEWGGARTAGSEWEEWGVHGCARTVGFAGVGSARTVGFAGVGSARTVGFAGVGRAWMCEGLWGLLE
ncbi:hypothetical protein HNY73_001891 [Argiope bruennichi]|uniref:Uncharacterized protein n=1 Tax=Argiope bruennichi TaxID=94029 RepID=A0A8T0FSX0_ARGBR|nr:hypothetical protein HNY73_001891 [Argiope bruennichi]